MYNLSPLELKQDSTMVKTNRRNFTRMISVAGLSAAGMRVPELKAGKVEQAASDSGLKISLNAYSFNSLLASGKMTIDDMLDFCVETGIEGLDITGYYFPGYPAVPPDDYIFRIKKKAFRLGIDLGCTGVRSDFTWADPAKRAEEKKLVKEWIVVAQKLGAPGVRIFAGALSGENYPWEERAKWIADDIRECAEFGKNHGVMLALQNHWDFIKTSEQADKMIKLINHDWVGLMLDTGNYRSFDPYKEIEDTAKYAISWMIKEMVYINEKPENADIDRIVGIVRKSGYRGYLPIETLGQGDPFEKVRVMYGKIKKSLG